MANTETVDRLIAYARAKGYSDPYPFVTGYLGGMVAEKTLQDHLKSLEKEIA